MKCWLTRGIGPFLLAGAALVLWGMPASAQGGGGGGGGSSSGGFGGGSTGGGGGGQSGTIFGSAGTGGGSSSSGTTTGQTPISTANPFQGYFASPLASGLGNNIVLQPANGSFSLNGGTSASNTLISGKGTFGVPLFGNIKNAASTNVNQGGGAMGGGAGGGSLSANVNNFSTAGMKRVPQYVTKIDFDTAPAPAAAQVRTDLANVLAQSPSLASARSLNVILQGQTVVLQGAVATEKERKLAESLMYLTPGVHNVRNEIVVMNKQP